MPLILYLLCLLFSAWLTYICVKKYCKSRLTKFLGVPVLFCLFLGINPVYHLADKALFSTRTAEELMMEDPGNRMIFLIFKDKFPQDYAQIVAKAEDLMKSKNHEQDMRFFLSETIDIMLRKLPYADDDNLIAMFQEDMQLRTKLLNENDTVNCFYLEYPHLAPDISLFSKQMKPYFASIKQARVRALQSADIHRKMPDETEIAQTQDKVNQILWKKYSEQELALINNDNEDEIKQYTAEEQALMCRFTIDTMQVILEQSKHEAAELIRFNLSH